MKISLITHIFAYSSNFPFRFLYIISKSKKMQEIIKSTLSNILSDNKLSLEHQSYINKYKLAQIIYLPIIEKNIEQKINGFSPIIPELKTIQEKHPNDKYVDIIYNNLKEELYEKYNSLKVFTKDIKYKNKGNKWFLENISDIYNLYFNNCLFIINDIQSIEVIIYLLYYNNYLNFQNILTIKKIKDKEKIKLILDDFNINYILEYPRAIIINSQFISQLLKSNINFYICSFENKNRLFNITFQRNKDLNHNNSFDINKGFSINYNFKDNEDNINLNIISKNNKMNYIYENKKDNNMIINKPNLSFKEINLYLKEYEIINAESLVFKNFLIKSSIYDYFFGNYKTNKKENNNTNNNNDKFNYIKSLNNNIMILNFEKDFFEIKENNKIYILHCSELINYMNNSNKIINLYLYNFPLSHLKDIKNKLIEFISIENFFNYNNDIIFSINHIKQRLPKIKKIHIKYYNYYNNKSITYINRNNTYMKDIILNLKEDNIKLNYDLNNINLKELYSIIESFEGINNYNFGLGVIKLYEPKENEEYKKINMIINENNILKEVDLNIFKYLNFENLLIYGHILDGIKPIDYLYLDENNNAFIEDFDLIEDINIFEIINTSINNFSETNFSLIFKNSHFFLPFIENIIIKINTKKLQKLLLNCIFGKEINLYNINLDILYSIKNENIKKINIYVIKPFNNYEFNIRYIYHNIPSLLSISINLFNTKIIFKKDILSFLNFKIRYKSDINTNKKIIILDFENSDNIIDNIHKIYFNIYSKDLVILNFNEKGIIILKDDKVIKKFNNNNNNLNILKYIYIITLIILLFTVLISNLY